MKNAGISNSDISAELGVSVRTIERYLTNANPVQTEDEHENESVKEQSSIPVGSTPIRIRHRNPKVFRRQHVQQLPMKSESEESLGLPSGDDPSSDSS